MTKWSFQLILCVCFLLQRGILIYFGDKPFTSFFSTPFEVFNSSVSITRFTHIYFRDESSAFVLNVIYLFSAAVIYCPT